MKKRWDKFWRKTEIYHIYFRRSGFYSTVRKSSYKLIGILLFFVIAILAFEYFVGDIGTSIQNLLKSLQTWQVLSIFFVSETILGMIPPDFFILWVKNFDNPFAFSVLLGVISYAGGFAAYLIGRRLSYTEKMNHYLNTRFRQNFEFINKWGGFFLVFAAMFPFPFAIASLVSGLVRFPVERFLLFGLTRILRFYIYAVALFNIA